MRRGLSRKAVATLLASDEFNIFATARYIRYVANLASQQDLRKLPRPAAHFPPSISAPTPAIRATGAGQ